MIYTGRVVLLASPQCVRHVNRMRETNNAYRFFVGKPLGKRLFGRPRGGYEDNIKNDLSDIACELGRWTDLVQYRVHLRCLVLPQ
jgi:hypothetical protein